MRENLPDRSGKKYPHDHLTTADVEAILDTFSRVDTAIRNRALITVIWRSGLRHAEVLALVSKDIDLDKQTIRVLHGKGDKARTVGMDSRTRDALSLLMEVRKRRGLTNGGPLFCTWKGAKLAQAYIRDMLAKKASKAGLEKRVTPHTLRHAFATSLHDEGVSMKAIQQSLGHSSLATTDVYLETLSGSLGVKAVQGRE